MEAIKAQAVAARTYVYTRWNKTGGKAATYIPEPMYVITHSLSERGLPKVKCFKKWEFFYYHYYSKISQAVESTAGMIVLYQGHQ